MLHGETIDLRKIGLSREQWRELRLVSQSAFHRSDPGTVGVSP
jgi:hypothetical protein